MDVALYASDFGILLLVPACMHPSQDAERRYGPLEWCGRANLGDVSDTDVRARIETDVVRSTYALLTVRDAQALFGSDHPCLRHHHRPQGLWPRFQRRRDASVRT